MQVVIFTHGDKGTPHLAAFRESNPGVGFTIVTNRVDQDLWRYHDRTIRNWWKSESNTVDDDDEYFWFFEWDCLVTTDLSKINLNYDIHCAYPRIPGIHDWMWWREIPRLPEELHCSARGMVPMGNFAIKTSAMDRICNDEWNGLFESPIYSELRFPTLAHHLGLSIIQEPNLNGCGYIPITREIKRPGIYHPVKQ